MSGAGLLSNSMLLRQNGNTPLLLSRQSPPDPTMGRLCIALITLLSAVSSSQDGISAAEVELRVRPGDNITLYCDCIITTGVYIMWYRNCSHKYQPPLVISTTIWHNPFPGYNVVWNPSNNSYDLLIENITGSDLGLYYCGTMEYKVEDEGGKGGIKQKGVYHYGNITTRISLAATETQVPLNRTTTRGSERREKKAAGMRNRNRALETTTRTQLRP
ncbi:hypothetical protein J4Q44_G00038490 [Coregonus suidteri]|uniref:Ig-like domain-containing protein n=1 Tax=Coregonus suidteri TaxID=861788 RepID=A0AAN8MDH9_9TELE